MKMMELHEDALSLVVGGADDGDEPAWTCGFWRDEGTGQIEMMCVGPFGDDVMDNTLDGCTDSGLPCFT